MEKDKNTLVWIFIAVIVALFFIGSFGMGGYGMMGFGFIFMLLFWVVLIWLVITLITASQNTKGGDDTLMILKRRYASGEITKKQFEEMKRGLSR